MTSYTVEGSENQPPHKKVNSIVPGDNSGKHEEEGCANCFCRVLRNNLLMLLTLVGIIIGFLFGLGMREVEPSDDAILWIGMPGTLFMRLLKMMITPLIVCSVITGASSLDPKTNGKVGGWTVLLTLLSHIVAALIAMGLYLAIQPGAGADNSSEKTIAKAMKTHDVFADLLRNLVPDNIITATFRQTITKYVLQETKTVATTTEATIISVNGSVISNGSVPTVGPPLDIYKREVSSSDGINVLGLITISAVFGIAAGRLGNRVAFFLGFVENLLALTLIIVRWFFWLTPIGVASLIASSILQVDSISQSFSDLGLFVAMVIIGLLIHYIVFLPVMYLIIVRKNPGRLWIDMFPAVGAAFGSTSSAVALPEMYHVCEDKFKMDKRITGIALPLSLTIQAAGSGLFMVAACMFITDYSGVGVTVGNTVVIMVLIVISALAIPGVPSASIFTIIVVLTSINVPLEHVAMLFAVEWLLDRVRTGVNCGSHMVVTACVNQLCSTSVQDTGEADDSRV